MDYEEAMYVATYDETDLWFDWLTHRREFAGAAWRHGQE